ncbi:MAG: nitroreductase family protein [Anaerolineae bacterium]
MDLATVDYLLTTTRSVRKRLDFSRPVEREVIERCLEIAIQAPSGSNRQHWFFVVITEPDKRAAIAELYRQSYYAYRAMMDKQPSQFPENDPRAARQTLVRDSSLYLANHMHEVPVLILPCVEGRAETADPFAQSPLYGSILPAAWSLMLALRARGLGSAWTTLHLRYEKEAAAILGIPDHITQAALLPVAYFTGDDFKPAMRVPAREVTFWNNWGERGKA